MSDFPKTMGSFGICLLMCISVVTPAPKTVSISLNKTDAPHITLLKQGMDLGQIEDVLNFRKNDSVIPVPLMRHHDSEYVGIILIGHPGQKLRVSFDTTWIDSWVPLISCSNIRPACATRKKYDPTRSKFSKATALWLNETSGNGRLLGRVFSDLVHIGQVNITNQRFAAVNEIPLIYVLYSFDGIIGMKLGHNTLMSTLMDNMKLEGLINAKVFAFYYNRKSPTDKGGTLAIGGVESRHYKGPINYVNIVPNSYDSWLIPVDNITVAQPQGKVKLVCKSGCNASMTTGGNSIYGPISDIQDINIAIGAQYLFYGCYSVDCNVIPTLPKLSFSIGGRNFTLTGYDYIQKVNVLNTATFCLSAFKTNFEENDSLWYIGAAFMSKYYTVFDMDQLRIGFADALLEEPDEISVTNVV